MSDLTGASQHALEVIRTEKLPVLPYTLTIGYDYFNAGMNLISIHFQRKYYEWCCRIHSYSQQHSKPSDISVTPPTSLTLTSVHLNLRDELIAFKNIIGQVLLDVWWRCGGG